MALKETLGFLGFGNMGLAIYQGLINAGTVTKEQCHVYDVSAARRQEAEQLGAQVLHAPDELLKSSDVILLMVKPQNMASALEHFEKADESGKLFISVAAGVTIHYLRDRIGENARVARVMPNTPALVGCGAAGIAMGPKCTERDAEVAQQIFESVGVAVRVNESQMNAVTALSGSGPAYFFYMVECLIHAAAKQGLSDKVATQLAAQTLLGAGRLLADSGVSAAVLRERVTSKGGTTEAALQCFEDGALADLVLEAFQCAVNRAEKLSNG